jgi:serine protease Do
MRYVFLAVLSLVILPLSASARSMPGSFADMVEKLSPAVVNISTRQSVKQQVNPFGGNSPFQFKFNGVPDGQADPFKEFFERFNERFGEGGAPQQKDVTSLGSGFVIDPSGYIVTNNHVIEQADEVNVIFQDETQYEAKVVGRDPKTDLALLKIEAKNLPYVEFGDSDALRVGDWVVAIGNPFGLGGSVSAGIVSARSRNINAGPFDDFIQTDAAINRGNSGGPLFNVEGKVVGVNSAIFSPSGGNVGIGFSIPAALAEPVLGQLREYGRTHRGWLGVKIQHVTEELAESLGLRRAKGALVLEVTPDGPAQKAGLQAGDVIVEFNGRAIDEMRNLPRLVAETKVGTAVTLSVWRSEKMRELKVKLGEMEEETDVAKASGADDAPKASKEAASSDWMGAQIAQLDDALRKRAGIDASVKGVIILNVKPVSAAHAARLMRADVIIEANQQEVSDVESLKSAVERARKQGKSHALLRVNRRGSLAFVTISTDVK